MDIQIYGVPRACIPLIIYGVPRACIPLTKAQIEVLMLCSEHHYDGLSKGASRVGGFLYGWRNAVTWAAEEGAPPWVRGVSTRDIDACLKILEMASVPAFLTEEQRTLAFQLSRDLRALAHRMTYESGGWVTPYKDWTAS